MAADSGSLDTQRTSAGGCSAGDEAAGCDGPPVPAGDAAGDAGDAATHSRSGRGWW